MTAEIRKFVDQKEMAEFKNVARAREDGYWHGKDVGFKIGLAAGVIGMLLVYIIVNLAGRMIW